MSKTAVTDFVMQATEQIQRNILLYHNLFEKSLAFVEFMEDADPVITKVSYQFENLKKAVEECREDVSWGDDGEPEQRQDLTLRWETEFDLFENTVHTAASCLGTEDDGPFYFRVKPVFRQDAILFAIKSDYEVTSPHDDDEEFETVVQAKAYCQKRNEEIAREQRK